MTSTSINPGDWLLHAADWCRNELPGTHTGAVGIAFFELTAQLWYWVLIGALLSALASHYLPRTRLAEVLGRHRAGSVVASSLVGLVSPLCTFAAIPVVSRLLQAGVPAPPMVAFLFASPLMNPALFAYTYGTLGLEMALARTSTALLIGLAAGAGTHLLQTSGTLARDLQPLPQVAGGSGAGIAGPTPSLGQRFLRDLSFIGRWFLLGILIAALTATFLKPEWIRTILGAGYTWSVPVAITLGVPLYACGGAAIPIVDTMVRLGMSKGAALAFFIAGPATKFHTLGTLGAVFGRRVLLYYLLLMLVAAMAFGYLYPFRGGEPLADPYIRGSLL
jgi:uncharacterized membrane protein YraQ (UPF0718 family)